MIMERKCYKEIHFDLDTLKMKELGLYPYGYSILGKELYVNGFEHRQGSGYTSVKMLNDVEVARAIRNIIKENLLLGTCIKKLAGTNVGVQYDLTELVKDVVEEYAEEAAAQQQAREERRAARGVAEPRKAEAGQQSIAAGTAAALERLKAMCPMYQLEVAEGGKEAADAKFNAAMNRPKMKMSGKGNAGQIKPVQRVRGKGKEKGKGKA